MLSLDPCTLLGRVIDHIVAIACPEGSELHALPQVFVAVGQIKALLRMSARARLPEQCV